MSKIQIFRLAKLHDIPSKDVMDLLKLHRVDFKTNFSSVDKESAERILARKYHIKLSVPKTVAKQPSSPKQTTSLSRPKLKKYNTPPKKGTPEIAPTTIPQEIIKRPKRIKIDHTEKQKSTQGDRRRSTKHIPISIFGMPSKLKKKKKQKQKKSKINNTVIEKKTEVEKGLTIYGQKTVSELAGALEISSAKLIKKLLDLGIMATKNDVLDKETMLVLADEFSYQFQDKKRVDVLSELVPEKQDKPEELKARPPVVTVMGHVDHGKTTLLDAIRDTRVASKEAGGITQNIGASITEVNGQKIVFIDTPGHAAFTQMRARGAQVTDLVILVVAADDGIMPQTMEAINHAKAAGVPILVAINKIDKPNAKPEKIKEQLSEHGLVWEKWGGNTVIAEISAKKKIGIDELLEMVLLMAQMAELKANPDKPAKGVVIESKVDSRQGISCTVLIKEGTLHQKDYFVAGKQWGRVRRLLSASLKQIKGAEPSEPVMILGAAGLPETGDILTVVPNEKIAKSISNSRQEASVSISKPAKHKTLESILNDIGEEEQKSLKLVVKADTVGAVEAFTQSMLELSSGEIKIETIHSAVGAISETDLDLADATEAIIIGFNVSLTPMANRSPKKKNIDIKLYNVIYEALNDLKDALTGMLKPTEIEEQLGVAEVRQIFKITKVGTIAGCYVTDGTIARGNTVKLIRNGAVIYNGKISNLKRFKEDAKEVSKGYECGISIAGYNDIKVDDSIEAYKIVEKKR